MSLIPINAGWKTPSPIQHTLYNSIYMKYIKKTKVANARKWLAISETVTQRNTGKINVLYL